MDDFIGFFRELRLMKDQPSHRFYAVWLLILLLISRKYVWIIVIFVGGLATNPSFLIRFFSRFF